MAKTESTFLNMLVVLTVTTLIVGAALGYVYNITKKPIAEAEQKQQIEAIQMVAPEFDNSPIKAYIIIRLIKLPFSRQKKEDKKSVRQ